MRSDIIIPTERRIEIYKMLKLQGTVKVTDLAEKFSVSTMTIRRDLAAFEKQGVITTTYGGAYLNEGTAIEPDFYLKERENVEIKHKMGIRACNLIEDGDSIIIDCGTTTVEVAKGLKIINFKRLTVITNSLIVANILHTNSNINLILAPGNYDKKSMGFISPLTSDFFKGFNVDKAFIGSQGFDIERGATVPRDCDAYVKKAMCQASKTRILMADHTKLGNSYLAKFADPEDISILITDDKAPKEYLHLMEKKGLKVIRDFNVEKEENND